MEAGMAKRRGRGGFNLHDSGEEGIRAPKHETDPSCNDFPKAQTMNNEAVRTGVAKNPSGERTA
jgi:hypothetical protein